MHDIGGKHGYLRNQERREAIKAAAAGLLFILLVVIMLVLQHKPTGEEHGTPLGEVPTSR
jgi:hypothetical protein